MTHIIDKQQGEKIVVIKGSCRCTEAVIDAFATPATIIHRNSKEAKKKEQKSPMAKNFVSDHVDRQVPPENPRNTSEHPRTLTCMCRHFERNMFSQLEHKSRFHS